MLFDMDFTFTVTHTETFEAPDAEAAKAVARRMLDDEGFLRTQLRDLVDDVDAQDLAHLTMRGPETSELSDPDDVTIDAETLASCA